jgi:2-haloacid dehalogenase
VTSHPDIDVIVFDILGTMVDEPSGIRRGLLTLLPDLDDAKTNELVEVWHRHIDEQQRQILEGRRPYVSSTVIDLEAATRVAAEAEEAQSYKPHPDVYQLAISNAGCPPDRLLMVAAHAWDLRGAQTVGMRTAYVERPVGDPPSVLDSFDLRTKSLHDLAMSLDASHRQ